MFDLNFISDPGMQKNTSDESWSFLQKKNETDKSVESDSKQSKTTSIQKNSWKHYVFVLTILGLIAVISILNSRYTQGKPNLLVLNQVIDLIDECSYIKTLQLQEATFLMDQIKVTIRSEDFTSIQALSHDYRLENEIPYEMYQKGKYSYLNLIFPWKGNGKSGDIYHIAPDDGVRRIVDIVHLICDLMGFNFLESVNLIKENYGQDSLYSLDASKAKHEFGWQQSITLENGIRETIDWIESNWEYISKTPFDYIHKE
mgnify:CR=1 FL=1